MPRKKQPQTLRQISLSALASTVLEACTSDEHDQISQYVRDIPKMFANEYVNELLRLCTLRTDHFSITCAFHPECTEINKSRITSSRHWYHQLLVGLHVMSELTVLKPNVEALKFKCDVMQELPFPRLSKLRSLKLALRSYPELLLQVVENCPRLEEIRVVTRMQFEWTPLAQCVHLKRIFVRPIHPFDAVYLLDQLPSLEILEVDDMAKVLPLCEHAYPLKSFVRCLRVSKSASVQKLVSHFPHLQELDLELSGDINLSPINELANLKGLTVRHGNCANLACLMDPCVRRLSKLALTYVFHIDSLFNEDVVPTPLETLGILGCTGINLAAIGKIFPKLKSFNARGDEFIALPPYQMLGFHEVESLFVTSKLPRCHLKSLLSSIRKLKYLDILNISGDMFVSQYLAESRLKYLCELCLHDDNMTKDVIPIILESTGDDLHKVLLFGNNMVLSRSEMDALSSLLQVYDIHFFVSCGEMQFMHDSRLGFY